MKLHCRKILCPIDFDSISIDTIEIALDLAKDNDATIYLMTVVPPEEKADAKAELDKVVQDGLRAVARKWFEGQVSYEVVVRSRRPAATVLKAEEDLDVDLVVMATRGRTGREHVRLEASPKRSCDAQRDPS